MISLEKLTRKNIWNLAPYSCARNEFTGTTATVFLDANENPFGAPYNRYPDPLQQELKKKIHEVKGIPASYTFLGNGSDEAIDLMYRCFCEPKADNVVAIEPTYGMYKVCAISREEIVKVLNGFDGLVVVDEAYSDFSHERPLRFELPRYKNLVVLNTLSKAWASAAIRLGMAFADPEIIGIMNKVKYPYNINLLTQEQALKVLNNSDEIDSWVKMILQERTRLIEAFGQLAICEKVYPTDANFFLAKVTDAQRIYDYLVAQGIIVRNRTRVQLCYNCLRITIGTRSENSELIGALRQYK